MAEGKRPAEDKIETDIKHHVENVRVIGDKVCVRGTKLSSDAGNARQAVIAIVITLIVQAVVSLIAVSVPIFMPVISNELNFSPAYVGIFVSLIYTGATISAPISGYYIDRYGPVFVSQICLLLCAVGMAVVSSASIIMIVSGALIIGLGYGPVTPASSQLLIRTTPPRVLAMVFSIKQTGVPLGGAIAGAVVPFLVLAHGWRAAAVCLGGFSLAVMIAMVPFRKHYDRYRFGGTQFAWKNLVKPLRMTFECKSLRPVVTASFFFATMQLILVSFLVTYLIRDVGMTLVTAGFMLSAAQASGIVGRIIWGVLADRYIRPRLMLGLLGISMTCTALVAALFSTGWPHSVILLASALFGAVAIGWNGVYLAEVARLARKESTGAITGGSLFFTFCGVLVGLPAFSLIVNKTGSYPGGFIIAAFATAICGTILCLSRSPGKASRRSL